MASGSVTEMETTVTEQQPIQAEEEILRLVRLCLRGRWEPQALEAARRLATQTELDGEALLQVAETERLGALLYQVVRGQNLLPPAVEEALHAARLTTALRDRFLREELATILERLAAQGVEVLLLKGAALAQTVYGGAGLRPMGDLDLLVHADAVQPALGTLAELGYRRVGREVRPGADLVYESHVRLDKTGLVYLAVEVHWSLFDSPYYQQTLPMAWFWDTALAIQMAGPHLSTDRSGADCTDGMGPGRDMGHAACEEIGNTPAWVLGPEAQILHLCGHLVVQHGDEEPRLLWLHDVAEVLVHYRDQLDWQELLKRAQDCALVLPLQRVLGQVAAEWGAPVPAGALAQLNALRPAQAEMQVVAWRTAAERPVAQRFWSDVASMSGWRQRLHYAWIQLFPSAAYMQERYGIRHRLLVPLYYPYRWWVGLRSVVAQRKS